MTKKIYVASSWRNHFQPSLVLALRALYEVYDFRNPAPGNTGFAWGQLDRDWEHWSPARFRDALQRPIAQASYLCDKEGMDWADTCVLLLPSGKSAHLEAGYMAGEGKKVIVYAPVPAIEPELMYKLLGKICLTWEEVLEELAK